MIAYKLYSECPPAIRPVNTPSEMVWTLEEIPDENKEEYELQGFTVVTGEEYLEYLASISSIIAEYERLKAIEKANSDLDTRLTNILASNQFEGLKMIVEFGKRNMLAGKTEDQIDLIMEDIDIVKLCLSLISGSYKYALRKASKINNPAITDSDKQYFIEKITDLLTRK